MKIDDNIQGDKGNFAQELKVDSLDKTITSMRQQINTCLQHIEKQPKSKELEGKLVEIRREIKELGQKIEVNQKQNSGPGATDRTVNIKLAEHSKTMKESERKVKAELIRKIEDDV